MYFVFIGMYGNVLNRSGTGDDSVHRCFVCVCVSLLCTVYVMLWYVSRPTGVNVSACICMYLKRVPFGY